MITEEQEYELPGCKFVQEFRFRSMSRGQFKYRACISIEKKIQRLEALERLYSIEIFSLMKLTSKPVQPQKLSFLKRLCLIISFWFIRCTLETDVFCNLQLFSSAAGFCKLGSHMVMPQSMISRSGNWNVANWIPPKLNSSRLESRNSSSHKSCQVIEYAIENYLKSRWGKQQEGVFSGYQGTHCKSY